MTTLLRVMTVFQGVSNMPEDRYVTNTQWSGPGSDFAGDAGRAFASLRTFWETPPGGPDLAVGAYISSAALRPYQMRAYNMLLPPKEREPIIEVGTLPAVANAAEPYPSEIAIVLTFVGGAAPYTAADRNRFYIGPVTVLTGAGSPARVGVTTRTSIMNAADRMRAEQTTTVWCCVSRVFNKVERAQPLIQPVIGGWVDNAFDVQRRRGEDASDRDLWGGLA